MWLFIAFLAVTCFVLAYLLYSENDKRAKLFEDYCEIKARQERAAEAADSRQAEISDDTVARQKPMSVDSIRTALRFNGISPEIPDTHEPDIIHFKIGDTKYRINAEHLPFMSIEVGYGLRNEPKEETALMYQAATDVTSQMFIGKAYIMGEAEAIIFSVELLCDSYMHLRNSLKLYLDILSDINKRFYEAFEALKERRKEEREAVFSGNCFVQDSPAAHKVQS